MPPVTHHWVATISARESGEGSRNIVLARFRFQAPDLYTPDHLHDRTVGNLLRVYGQRLAARRCGTCFSKPPPTPLAAGPLRSSEQRTGSPRDSAPARTSRRGRRSR
jgi:hypothetical protein